jgi:hypothetical protein
MAITTFDVMGHCASIGASFVVLVAVAAAIDWLLRWLERRRPNPGLLQVLHGIAMTLVVLDGVLILVQAGQEPLQLLKPLFIALA